MKIEGEKLIFSTGETERVNGGIVGLSPDGEVYGGYDDIVFNLDSDVPDLTDAECVELADYMILQWADFRAKHKEAGG